MSWTDMVKNNLLGTGSVSKAAICGLDGSVWGLSDNFKLEANEAVAVVKAVQDPQSVLGSGLRFEGEKFFVLQADDERIIGKKTANGFFIYKTARAIIIAIYEDGLQPEQCSKITGALADYLKSISY